MRLLQVKIRAECRWLSEAKYIQLTKDLYLKWGWNSTHTFNKGLYSSPKKLIIQIGEMDYETT